MGFVLFYSWVTNVSTFPELDHQKKFGPTWVLEYSTREAYGSLVPGWSPSDPLNATWWHHVTEGSCLYYTPSFQKNLTNLVIRNACTTAIRPNVHHIPGKIIRPLP